MDQDIIYFARSNEKIYYYLKFHSYLYKDIMRDSIDKKTLEEMMKKEFRLTTGDKINEMVKRLEMVRSFLDILH